MDRWTIVEGGEIRFVFVGEGGLVGGDVVVGKDSSIVENCIRWRMDSDICEWREFEVGVKAVDRA